MKIEFKNIGKPHHKPTFFLKFYLLLVYVCMHDVWEVQFVDSDLSNLYMILVSISFYFYTGQNGRHLNWTIAFTTLARGHAWGEFSGLLIDMGGGPAHCVQCAPGNAGLGCIGKLSKSQKEETS